MMVNDEYQLHRYIRLRCLVLNVDSMSLYICIYMFRDKYQLNGCLQAVGYRRTSCSELSM